MSKSKERKNERKRMSWRVSNRNREVRKKVSKWKKYLMIATFIFILLLIFPF